jgi:hypothetical protein
MFSPYRPFSRCAAAVTGVLILAGCTAHRAVIPFGPGITAPRTIALLPLDNQTNSVPGALYLREAMQGHLRDKGYVATPLEEVDRTLADQLGISLGGQVSEELIPRVGTTLGVDAVLTGTLQKFATVLALYSEVEATFVMYESASGRKIWEYHDYVKQDTALSHRDANSVTLTAAVIASLMERGAGKPLQSVVAQFYRRLLNQMPTGAAEFAADGAG